MKVVADPDKPAEVTYITNIYAAVCLATRNFLTIDTLLFLRDVRIIYFWKNRKFPSNENVWKSEISGIVQKEFMSRQLL